MGIIRTKIQFTWREEALKDAERRMHYAENWTFRGHQDKRERFYRGGLGVVCVREIGEDWGCKEIRVTRSYYTDPDKGKDIEIYRKITDVKTSVKAYRLAPQVHKPEKNTERYIFANLCGDVYHEDWVEILGWALPEEVIQENYFVRFKEKCLGDNPFSQRFEDGSYFYRGPLRDPAEIFVEDYWLLRKSSSGNFVPKYIKAGVDG